MDEDQLLLYQSENGEESEVAGTATCEDVSDVEAWHVKNLVVAVNGYPSEDAALTDEQAEILDKWAHEFHVKYHGDNDNVEYVEKGELGMYDSMMLEAEELESFINDLQFPVDLAAGAGVSIYLRAVMCALKPETFATVVIGCEDGKVTVEYSRF